MLLRGLALDFIVHDSSDVVLEHVELGCNDSLVSTLFDVLAKKFVILNDLLVGVCQVIFTSALIYN